MSRARTRRTWLLNLFEIGVVGPSIAYFTVQLAGNSARLLADDWVAILVWVTLIALVELLTVPMWRGTHIGMGFPLLMVVAFVYDPVAAAAAAFLAASDPREIKREVGLLRALFNRSQVALSVGAASLIFHSVASIDSSGPLRLLAGASLAAVADYLVNATLVCLAASIHYWMNPLRVIRELRVGRLSEFVISYLGLAVFGVVLAKVFSIKNVGFYAVPAFVIPLLLARQMFFRSKALEEAHTELQDARAGTPSPVEPDGRGATGRTSADRGVPARRSGAAVVPAFHPSGRRSAASRVGQARGDRDDARGDQGDEEPDVRPHPSADPRSAPVAARPGWGGRGAAQLHRGYGEASPRFGSTPTSTRWSSRRRSRCCCITSPGRA